MNNTPKISVIMALYNGEKYVKQAIESILHQTFQDFEILVVDDASTDESFKAVQAIHDERIVLLRNEVNSGPSYSRNRAIREAKGDFLAILDADDVAMPERLEMQYEYMQKHDDVDAVGAYIREVDSEGKPLRAVRFPISPDELKASFFFRCSIVHSAAFIRRSFFIANNLFYDDSYTSSQDFEMWSRLIYVGKVATVGDYLVDYRISQGQISTARMEEQRANAAFVYGNMMREMGIAEAERNMEAHLVLITQVSLADSELTVKDVENWCVCLKKQNEKRGLIDRKAFQDELLMRFLRFCMINRVSKVAMAWQYLHLICKMGHFSVPIRKINSRTTKTLG